MLYLNIITTDKICANLETKTKVINQDDTKTME